MQRWALEHHSQPKRVSVWAFSIHIDEQTPIIFQVQCVPSTHRALQNHIISNSATAKSSIVFNFVKCFRCADVRKQWALNAFIHSFDIEKCQDSSFFAISMKFIIKKRQTGRLLFYCVLGAVTIDTKTIVARLYDCGIILVACMQRNQVSRRGNQNEININRTRISANLYSLNL